MDRVTGEVLVTRAALGRATAPAERDALAARFDALSSSWCAMARSVGLAPPDATFDPRLATDRELENALRWATVGNTFPRGSFEHPVLPSRHLDELLTEHVVRTPSLLDGLLRANAGDARLAPLLERDLARGGDSSCRAADGVDALVARRDALLRTEASRQADADAKRIEVGLDGRVGTAPALARYEQRELLIALNPGTTVGSLLASYAALRGHDIDTIRAAGKAGNVVEGIGALAGGPPPYVTSTPAPARHAQVGK
jgi:hypothetical protein